MKIPTRTPEGWPNRCPICGKRLRLEPSLPSGDAPCPHCGSLVWFAKSSHYQDKVQEEFETLARLLIRLGRKRFGEPTPEVIDAIESVDSADELAAMTRRVIEATGWFDVVSR